MKKIYIIIISLFLLTGCDVKYDLVYDNEILSESLNVTSLKNDIIDGRPFFSLVDEKYAMPLLVNYKLEPGDASVEECDMCEFYNKKLINNNSLYGINLHYDYIVKENISNSSIAYTLFESVEVTDNSIEANSPKNIFSSYPELDEIVVTFKTDKKVIETNCQEVKDETYYWYIDKDNYEYASINIQIDNTVNKIEYDKRADNITKYSILGTIVFVVGLGLFVFVKVINSNKK